MPEPPAGPGRLFESNKLFSIIQSVHSGYTPIILSVMMLFLTVRPLLPSTFALITPARYVPAPACNLKPSMVTSSASTLITEFKPPPSMMDSLTREVDVPVVPAFAPLSVSDLLIATFSAYVPSHTCTVSPEFAAFTASWMTVYVAPGHARLSSTMSVAGGGGGGVLEESERLSIKYPSPRTLGTDEPLAMKMSESTVRLTSAIGSLTTPPPDSVHHRK